MKTSRRRFVAAMGASAAWAACGAPAILAKQGARVAITMDDFGWGDTPALDAKALNDALLGHYAARRLKAGVFVTGNRVDSEEGRAYWAREIEPHVGRDGVEYVGPVDDAQKNALLGSAAAMLVPIEWDEPFGIVFAEAQACGTPVISCPRGALTDIVQPGLHGFLVRGVEEGIEAIGRIGEIDRRACRENAEKRFSREVAGDNYLALYRDLLAKARP